MSEMVPLPQRVLMTTDTVGGVWSYSVDLARGLAARGVEVALATMGGPLSEAQRETTERIPGLRVFESTFRVEWMEDPWRDVERAGDWLLALETRIAPDLVHLNGYAHAALPWIAPKLVVAHSCMLSWWSAVKGEPAPEAWDRYRREAGAGLAAADLVVAPTASVLADLAHHHGLPRRSRVIGHGRDGRLFRPAAKEPIVFAAGGPGDEAKNLGALERIAPEVPWTIYVAGETAPPDAASRGARAHFTRHLGRLSPRALAAWLGRSAIYALPARYEPFGLAVLEAALAGCALVLGDIPSLRETWRNRAAFVPPDDPPALAAALTRLIEDPDRRASLAAGARKRAVELTPERMLAGYLAAYGELLGERALPLAAGLLASAPMAV